MDAALDGVTVVDLTRYLPGPYCTKLLADLGAAVVKVEPPAGDPARTTPWYELLNARKRIVVIDLGQSAGRDELDRLLAGARVCVEGFRPSTAKALRVDAESLRARHPHLVHCSITGYGQQGPDAERAGHDVNYQAEAGLIGDRPAVPAMLMADITGAYQAALRIAAAIAAGRGASIDVSLKAAAASWVPFTPPPVLRGDYACYNVYATAGADWVALGALEPKFWARFCERAGRPEWIAQQFVPDPVRPRLIDDVRRYFANGGGDHWAGHFAGADCCLSVIGAHRRRG
jgi:alpha-methylacyl-CoA racemase